MSVATKNNSKPKSDRALPTKTFCEFFAGIGLVREGLHASGWRCVYANDIDTKKQEQYNARFDDGHFHLEDVHQTEKVLAEISGRPALATASFPCIDLSLAGHGRGFEGKHSSTIFGFTEVIDAMNGRRPKLILVENVTGFLSSHEGKDFERVVCLLAELGYYLDSFVLDAKCFVPQSRPRVFIVGIHKSVIKDADVVHSTGEILDSWRAAVDDSRAVRPPRLVRLMESIQLQTGWVATRITAPPNTSVHLRELIDTDSDQDWWDEAQVTKHYKMMSDLHRGIVDELIRDKKETHVGTIYRRKRYGSTKAEVRFDGIAGCLRVPRGGSARQIVIVIDRGKLKIRWMSPREYARLQGSPDFPLVGRATQQMAGFGDAVCVPVIEWIDKRVLSPLYQSISS